VSTNASPIQQLAVNTIKGLAMDAVQKANSGHPGMPMGMADVSTVLFTQFLKYDANDPTWPDRDRFVLSAGHGSMLLYALLHLTGVKDPDAGTPAVSMDDIKDFRQWGSNTPGHPEYGHTWGVETTTGPLGQGISMAVGMALAEVVMANKFGAELCDHNTYCIAGDGDLMEGVTHEAVSLAGTLKLGKLVVLYDDNNITIDGATHLSFTDDTPARFRAMGWHVVPDVDGHDHKAIASAIAQAKASELPSIICCKTVIGQGSPNKQGKSASHGSPLGTEEIRITKEGLGMDPDKSFVVPDEVLAFFRAQDGERSAAHASWADRLRGSDMGQEWLSWHMPPNLADVEWPTFEAGKGLATRKSSHAVLNAIASAMPNVIGGSADLAGSNGTMLKGETAFSADNRAGRNLYFGVREHGMAAICNGMSLHGGLRPYCATFLVFHDYHRPSVRLSSLMSQPVIYIYTHDSIYLGEDGPTHQPVEQLMAMRLIPNNRVMRPADANETVEAWKSALEHLDGPTCLVFTRQGLPTLDQDVYGSALGVHQGAYVLAEADGEHHFTLIASGSEVELALRARDSLQGDGFGTRVVSMPCMELFEEQDELTQYKVLGDAPRIAIEAGRTLGWERYAEAVVGHDDFGASAPAEVLMEELDFTVERIRAAAALLMD
jgi:transketolase